MKGLEIKRRTFIISAYTKLAQNRLHTPYFTKVWMNLSDPVLLYSQVADLPVMKSANLHPPDHGAQNKV